MAQCDTLQISNAKDLLGRLNHPAAQLGAGNLLPKLQAGLLVQVNQGGQQGQDKRLPFQVMCNEMIWVDEQNRTCWEKFARALKIKTGGDYGNWTYQRETFKPTKNAPSTIIEVAKLCGAAKLSLNGTFEALYPTITEVLFDFRMEPTAIGWECPVICTLTDPNGIVKCSTEADMRQYIGKGYSTISIGKVWTPCVIEGNWVVKVEELSGMWKTGLVVRGIIFRTTH